MLTVTLKNRGQENCILKYDAASATLYQNEKVFKRHNLPLMTPATKIREIRISLGLNCNMNCKYCSQHKTIINKPLPDMSKYVDQLCTIIDNHCESHVMLQFWGGEPLLYFDIIKDIVERIKLKNISKAILFGFITNGALLSNEAVDYLIKNRFSVCISHDAEGQYLRSSDPLVHKELILRLLQTEMPCAFNPVITNGNFPPSSIVDFFKKEFPGLPVVIPDGSPIIVSHADSKNYVALAENLFNYAQLLTLDLVRNPDVLQYFIGYRQAIDWFKRSLTDPYDYSDTGLACATGSASKLTVDLYGNVITCQCVSSTDSTNGISHIAGSLESIINKEPLSYPPLVTSWQQQCDNCPVLFLCRRGCPIETREYWEDNCKIKFMHNYALFTVAMLELTDMIVQKIEGDFKFQALTQEPLIIF